MKLLFLKLFACLSCIIFTSSCEKEQEVTELSDEFKAYTYFKEGTWWVYKNAEVEDYDTSRVVYFYSGTQDKSIRTEPPEKFEVFANQITMELVKGEIDTLTGGGGAIPEYTRGALVNGKRAYYLTVNNYKYAISEVMLVTPAKVGFEMEGGTSHIAELNDSLKIQGKYYYETITVRHTPTNGGETNDLIISETYAKNVGVVRRVFSDGRVMELVDYELIK